MLLEIEVYPAPAPANLGDVADDASPPTPSQTLWVHPSTSTRANPADDAAAGGRERLTALTVGRKEPADALLPGDRSVSRLHCRVHLVLAAQQQQQHPQQRNNRDGVRADRHPTSSSPSSCEAVLENVSKTGCYVVVRRQPASDSAERPNKDDDDSDATDVEDNLAGTATQVLGGGSNKRAPAQSAATQRFVPETQGTSQHETAAGGAPTPPFSPATLRILTDIIHEDPLDYELVEVPARKSFALEALRDRCGTVVVQCGKLGSTLRFTRRDFILLNKTKQPKVPLSAELLEAAGAALADDRQFDPVCTHLVTRQCSSTPSQLAAWCRCVPMVTPDFLRAWAERRRPTDPVPKEADYSPKANESFWAEQPPSWTGWTYLTEEPAKASDEELLALVRATGAIARIVRDPSDLLSLLESSPRRCFATANRHLLTSSALEAHGIVACDAKGLAKRLTQQLYPDGSPAPSSDTASVEANRFEKQRPQLPEPNSISVGTQPTAAPSILQPARSALASQSKGEEKRTRTAHPRNDPSPSPVEPSPPLRRSPNEAKEASDVADDTGRDPDENARDPDAAESLRNAGAPGDEDHYKAGPQIEESPRPRKIAKTKSDGWFAAIDETSKQPPRDNERTPLPPAATEVVKGYLLVQPLGRPGDAPADSSSSPSPTTVDFRAFRKNSVPAAAPRTTIKFVSVQPKESRSLQHLEAQLHDLEERQRAAEQLFRDPVFPGGRACAR